MSYPYLPVIHNLLQDVETRGTKIGINVDKSDANLAITIQKIENKHS